MQNLSAQILLGKKGLTQYSTVHGVAGEGNQGQVLCLRRDNKGELHEQRSLHQPEQLRPVLRFFTHLSVLSMEVDYNFRFLVHKMNISRFQALFSHK